MHRRILNRFPRSHCTEGRVIHGRRTSGVRCEHRGGGRKEGGREWEEGGECRNGIISGVRCVCVRACVKAAAAAVAAPDGCGGRRGWARVKGGCGINRKQGSKAKRKSLPSRAYASVDGSIRSSSPSCDRRLARSLPLALSHLLSPSPSLSHSRSLRERPIVFEFADRRSEIPEIRLLTPE